MIESISSSFPASSLMAASITLAYVGPGLGVGVVATVFGVLGAILLFVVGVVYYPIKRLFTRRRANDDSSIPPTEASQ